MKGKGKGLRARECKREGRKVGEGSGSTRGICKMIEVGGEVKGPSLVCQQQHTSVTCPCLCYDLIRGRFQDGMIVMKRET